ncbi:MAG: RNA 2',3'-cyclic phosphodiesterase [Gammaproteobacteria bacterium]|nr:RNA 2',3'-cyclic phosphodiesterase [Gammaproteobacteria bacterium]
MADTKRLFFALWPDDTIRNEISQTFLCSAYSKAEGQRYNFQNLHLTLHFLGNASEEQYSCFLEAAEKVKFTEFTLSLDKFSVFEKAKVFWLGVSDIPAELKQLHYELGEVLTHCGYKGDDRIYTPHVTLMRKIKHFVVEKKAREVSWPISQFALVESVTENGAILYKPVKFYNT